MKHSRCLLLVGLWLVLGAGRLTAQNLDRTLIGVTWGLAEERVDRFYRRDMQHFVEETADPTKRWEVVKRPGRDCFVLGYFEWSSNADSIITDSVAIVVSRHRPQAKMKGWQPILKTANRNLGYHRQYYEDRGISSTSGTRTFAVDYRNGFRLFEVATGDLGLHLVRSTVPMDYVNVGQDLIHFTEPVKGVDFGALDRAILDKDPATAPIDSRRGLILAGGVPVAALPMRDERRRA